MVKHELARLLVGKATGPRGAWDSHAETASRDSQSGRRRRAPFTSTMALAPTAVAPDKTVKSLVRVRPRRRHLRCPFALGGEVGTSRTGQLKGYATPVAAPRGERRAG